MLKQQITTTQGAPPGGAYSQGLRAGAFVFVSGQGPVNPNLAALWGTTSVSRRCGCWKM